MKDKKHSKIHRRSIKALIEMYEKSGLTFKELDRKAGITHATILQLRASLEPGGPYKTVTFEMADRLCKACGKKLKIEIEDNEAS